MHITWVSDFRKGTASGATSQAILCGKALKEAGLNVTFVNTTPVAMRTEDRYIKSEISGVPLLYPVKNLKNTLRKENPDVVLLHCFSEDVLRELNDITREFPTIVRVGINVLELLVTPGYAKKIPQAIHFMRSADHIVAASENTRHICEGLGCRPEDITVIHTAVDPTQFKVTKCQDPTLAILGRVFQVKNHLTLLEAVKLVRKDFPDVELAITGSGRLANLYSELIPNLLLAPRVKATGFMNDLEWLFREVSILALPSLSENMPFCVLEAYASGVPCVLSDSGWGDTFQAALKAKHDNPREWADQLLKLLTDRKFYLKVRKRQFKELQKFTVDKMVPKYLELFEKMMELNKYKVKRFSSRLKT